MFNRLGNRDDEFVQSNGPHDESRCEACRAGICNSVAPSPPIPATISRTSVSKSRSTLPRASSSAPRASTSEIGSSGRVALPSTNSRSWSSVVKPGASKSATPTPRTLHSPVNPSRSVSTSMSVRKPHNANDSTDLVLYGGIGAYVLIFILFIYLLLAYGLPGPFSSR
jgi:hypothetical protein